MARRPAKDRALGRKCSIAQCGRAFYCRGWCQLHYERWKRNGDPLIVIKPKSGHGAPREWLKANARSQSDDCLIWPFARMPSGAAHMHGAIPARVMCEMVHGPAPTPTHEAAHSCGKAHLGCVTPRHLRWATPKENAADKEIHGTVVRAEDHYAARFTNDEVRHIRSLKGRVKQKDIAERYGVGRECISKIMTGKRWGSV